ncbi:MAG TPA: YhjD/YihY/BrkB family envelope integrity protein, partial [Clostridia bacterium]|nr:YhjD/YihY/BrkB family envelope integrity protein [Clostridia bacterium]
MAKKPGRLDRWRAEAQALLDERVIWRGGSLTRLQKFAHFWVLVGRSFVRNRCPVRASALAYATLLALIPMLAVVVSVTSTFLKKEGEDRIDQFIMHAVASVTPPGMLATNRVAAHTNVSVIISEDTNAVPGAASEASQPNAVHIAEGSGTTNQTLLPSFVQGKDALDARRQVARSIHDFIQNTRSGAMGVTGTVVLIFVAISMLARIEDTFNDIWGVVQGRSWFTRIVLYWGVISLAPLLMVLAVALITGPQLEGTKEFLSAMPLVSSLLFRFLPILVLCLTFSLFYMAVPNVK